MQQENTLKKVREIIGDDIPEAVLQHGVICWKVNTGRKPNQPFLVCEYETFERVCKYLQLIPSHVKATIQRKPYACFELNSFRTRLDCNN